ncbi:MAG: excinuclease ABC subunit UvrA [Candidatus Pacebacteria bacterium]|nr:excinuclease ABC subunit UvrA [Candidatus Paceibacterota bacterium]
MKIKIRNACQNNLRNLTLEIPRNRLVVFTGLSGSGKSSLVFDTIYAEAQRQYLESLSVFARKRLPVFSRPKVDEICNLSPAIMIDQKKLGQNLRSTVGTVTEIYTYLRLLYSRCGQPRIGDSTLFSFNTAEGMCPTCRGLGEKLVVNQDRLIDWEKTLNQGAIRHSEYAVAGRRWSILRVSGLFEMDRPLKNFSQEEINKLLFSESVPLTGKDDKGFVQHYSFEGIVTGIKRRRLDKRGLLLSSSDRETKFFKSAPCDDCGGSRLTEKARIVKVAGKTLPELVALPLIRLPPFFKKIFDPLADPIVVKIKESLSHLIEIGVGYLSLDRSVNSLSGGESQRVKMARQLGSNLIEQIYILDEPSIGLHSQDMTQLIGILKKLKEKGNTVFVVEHDPAIIKIADQIIDLGPGSGRFGGRLVYQGQVAGLKNCPESITGLWLKKETAKIKGDYRRPRGSLSINNASLHNLKNVSLNIPLGVFVGVSGVAGSGKSTLINDCFASDHPEAVVVDQKSVGRMSRSNPATYIKVFDLIRQEFALKTGRQPGLFSFNSRGACPQCQGLGVKKIDMNFLEAVVITCSRCQGQRYREEVLKIKHQGRNIADILKMTASEAKNYFENERIKERLVLLERVGLDYLELGQPLTTLSGGEAQRIKLISQLRKKGQIYILDEPTTGLHLADIGKLLEVLNKLVDEGNTVIVIEHNLQVIAQCDWLVDLGPGGGEQGGEIVALGTPKEVSKNKLSITGRYLKDYFKG